MNALRMRQGFIQFFSLFAAMFLMILKTYLLLRLDQFLWDLEKLIPVLFLVAHLKAPGINGLSQLRRMVAQQFFLS